MLLFDLFGLLLGLTPLPVCLQRWLRIPTHHRATGRARRGLGSETTIFVNFWKRRPRRIFGTCSCWNIQILKIWGVHLEVDE